MLTLQPRLELLVSDFLRPLGFSRLPDRNAFDRAIETMLVMELRLLPGGDGGGESE